MEQTNWSILPLYVITSYWLWSFLVGQGFFKKIVKREITCLFRCFLGQPPCTFSTCCTDLFHPAALTDEPYPLLTHTGTCWLALLLDLAPCHQLWPLATAHIAAVCCSDVASPQGTLHHSSVLFFPAPVHSDPNHAICHHHYLTGSFFHCCCSLYLQFNPHYTWSLILCTC